MQVCTTLQTDNHASTPTLSSLQAGCPSCRPTNSIKALKATVLEEAGRKTVGCLSLLCNCCDHIDSLLFISMNNVSGASYNPLGVPQ